MSMWERSFLHIQNIAFGRLLVKIVSVILVHLNKTNWYAGKPIEL